MGGSIIVNHTSVLVAVDLEEEENWSYRYAKKKHISFDQVAS